MRRSSVRVTHAPPPDSAKSPVTTTGLFAFWARLYRSFSTYQTRILSVANKVNLDFAEAAPPLRSGLVRVIAGPF
ncbi:complement resistance protein TraT [Paraburkholderia youngii]|uniref:Uncharacterized protein n=1 Tax=Paraburkholderia youngii TaxID=2782701 RepID=A0ABX2NM84_9BURK|nr:complement resistance protein TraT [Paraburkholderia youngii]NVI05502.1 hypothetical protein [Paraburkholderia youngii]